MNEQDLERLARRLGEREAGAIDPERTAQRVVARLNAERHDWRVILARTRLLRIAAAAALVVALGLWTLWDRGGDGGFSAESLTAAVQGLETLEPAELVEVLDSLALTGSVTSMATTSLNDLSTAQLEELLAQMEG